MNSFAKRLFQVITRSSKEHHGSPCDGSVKSVGPLCCHTSIALREISRRTGPIACGRMSEQFL